MKTKPALIVLSKVDAPSILTEEAVKTYLRIEEIQSEREAPIRVVSANFVSRESCAPILDWIEDAVNAGK